MPVISIPEEITAFLKTDHKMLIDGKWVDAASGERLDVIDPSTGEVVASVPAAGGQDVDHAVHAARQAFEDAAWRRISPSERGRLIWRLADLIEERAEDFAVLDVIDNGKPISFTRNIDVPLSYDLFRYMAGWSTKIEGNTISHGVPYTPDTSYFTYTLRQPVGVVAQIIPWNYPLMMAAYKLAPALAAGCTCVLKPAEQTPLSALLLGELVEEAGFPRGVVNIVTGYGEQAGAALVEHPNVDKVAFTGSGEVGRLIVQGSASSNLKRVSLELGGKSPHIIFEDADLERATEWAANGIFFNQGQACCAGSRLFVQRSVAREVIDGVVARAKSMRLGPGLDTQSEMGPLVSQEQKDRVLGYIKNGIESGGAIATPEPAVDGSGYFVRPTVLLDVPPSARAVREEIFGPVLTVTIFDDEAEVVRRANDTTYGLAAALWTRNVSRAHRVAGALAAGTVWVNTYHVYDAALPFGGFKQSGWGREMGHDVFNAYTETKTVIVEIEEE